MPARQTAVFIDGGYWSVVLREEFRLPRIDFAKLIEFMAAGNDLLRTYYYNCMPYQSNPPTQEESERYGRARRFIDALSRLPRFEIDVQRERPTHDLDGVPRRPEPGITAAAPAVASSESGTTVTRRSRE